MPALPARIHSTTRDASCRTVTNRPQTWSWRASRVKAMSLPSKRSCAATVRAFFVLPVKFFRQRSLVEEAAQEVFLKAFTELGSYEGRGSMEGWLTRITTNTCLNMLRSSKRRPELTVV